MKKPNRGHLEILEEIDKQLATNGFHFERNELEEEIRACSTGSELCLVTGSILLKYRKKNTQVVQVIDYLIDEFVSYCQFNGLYPIARK